MGSASTGLGAWIHISSLKLKKPKAPTTLYASHSTSNSCHNGCHNTRTFSLKLEPVCLRIRRKRSESEAVLPKMNVQETVLCTDTGVKSYLSNADVAWSFKGIFKIPAAQVECQLSHFIGFVRKSANCSAGCPARWNLTLVHHVQDGPSSQSSAGGRSRSPPSW